MSKINPENFSVKPVLDGTELLFTQTNGISQKFRVQDLLDLIPAIQPQTTPVPYVFFPNEEVTGEVFESKPVYETIVILNELEAFSQGSANSPTFNIGIEKLIDYSIVYIKNDGVQPEEQTMYFTTNGKSGVLTDNKFLTIEVTNTGMLQISQISTQITNDDTFNVLLRYTKI